jgi:hypothetical protein
LKAFAWTVRSPSLRLLTTSFSALVLAVKDTRTGCTSKPAARDVAGAESTAPQRRAKRRIKRRPVPGAGRSPRYVPKVFP